MSDKPTSRRPPLTSAAGIPVADNQNALTAGRRVPLLVQDWQLFAAEIVERQLGHFAKADSRYAEGVRAALTPQGVAAE